MSTSKGKRKVIMPIGACPKFKRSKFKVLENNIVNIINTRSLGLSKSYHHHNQRALLPNHGQISMIQNNLFKERLFQCDAIDKVFSSHWINSNQVAFGTKCNKLMILDVDSSQCIQIQNLKSNRKDVSTQLHSGIHAIAVNPSNTLLATGAENSNEVAVYSLPTFDPVCIGQNAHDDWIFDVTWLDDEFFVTGSRDTTIALWHVESDKRPVLSESSFKYPSIRPLLVRKCKRAEKIRALVFNKHYLELVALSLNACLHLWDIHTLTQKHSHSLPFNQENVCLALQETRKIYAVGSKWHVSFHDTCTLKLIDEVPVEETGSSIRSASFNGDILTFGTGAGNIMFYDIRARKYIEHQRPSPVVASRQNLARLSTSRGYFKPNVTFWELYQSSLDYYPAVYTHCYDSTGTRLFAAGGPLPVFLEGYYLSLWN